MQLFAALVWDHEHNLMQANCLLCAVLRHAVLCCVMQRWSCVCLTPHV